MNTEEVMHNSAYADFKVCDIMHTMERNTALISKHLPDTGGLMKKKQSSIPIGRTGSLDIEGIHAMGPLEADVMEVVWRLGKAKVVDVVKILRPRKEYQTVMTVLSNLAKKGLLYQDRSHKTYEYTPLKTKEEYENLTVSKALDSLFTDYPEAVKEYMETRLKDSVFGPTESSTRARSTNQKGRTDGASLNSIPARDD